MKNVQSITIETCWDVYVIICQLSEVAFRRGFIKFNGILNFKLKCLNLKFFKRFIGEIL